MEKENRRTLHLDSESQIRTSVPFSRDALLKMVNKVIHEVWMDLVICISAYRTAQIPICIAADTTNVVKSPAREPKRGTLPPRSTLFVGAPRNSE